MAKKKPFDHSGTLVLVTGAASGIGRSAAIAFARRGANIVAADIRLAPLEEVKRAVEALGVSCAIFAVDVADETAMKQFAQDVAFGPGVPHVLVNNAGIGYMGPFLESTLEHWPRIMNVNLMGVVHGCHFFLPKMIAAGGKRRVLNVASAAANYPPPSLAAYAASKFAVFGFSEVLKMELSKTQVGITTVCPGVIDTAIVSASPDAVSPAVGEAQRDRLQAYYKKNGASPDVVGEAMVRAVERDIDILNVGPAAALFSYLRRISIALARKLSYASAKTVGYRA